MPIEYQIDHVQRLVRATARGTFTDRDAFGYQRAVWSRSDVAGYDELMDMSGVEKIELPSPNRVMQLARLAAGMDVEGPPSKFAIVAPENLAFGLGRMFQVHRGMEDGSTKQVGVFRTLADALAYLGR